MCPVSDWGDGEKKSAVLRILSSCRVVRKRGSEF